MRRRVLTLISAFGLAGVLWLAWNHPYLKLDVAAAIDPSRPATATALHKHWILGHPISFLPPFGRFLRRDIWEQWPVFFGDVGGWVSSRVHRMLAGLSLAFLIGLVGAEIGRSKRDPLWASALITQSIALLFATCLVLYLSLGTVGLGVIPGLGGRYLPMVYLTFLGGALSLLPALGRRWSLGCFCIGIAANATGLLVILAPTLIAVWR